MTENETGEPKAESAQVEEQHIGFRQRWLELVEEAVDRRRWQERPQTIEFGGGQTGIVFQTGLVALIEALFRALRHKPKAKPKKRETNQ